MLSIYLIINEVVNYVKRVPTAAEEYWKSGQMLLNGGELNGKRILSPRTVSFMTAVHAPDTLPGGPPAKATASACER
jgi:hypothetical protein